MSRSELMINCDMGESFGRYQVSDEDAIMPMIHACNVACGFHAGDPLSIQKTIARAQKNDVKIGAHPSYPDLQGFGRRKMDIDPTELESMVRYQIAAVDGMVRAVGAKLHHVKAHGALYNTASVDHRTAKAICRAIRSIDGGLVVFAPFSSVLASIAREMQLTVMHEAFIDRAYHSDLTLLSRKEKGAVISDSGKAVAQVRSILYDQQVSTIEGDKVHLQADTFCIHGDNPAAISILHHLHTQLTT